MLRFVGNGDQKKITKNPRLFSMQNSLANTKKLFTKCFWRAGKVTKIQTLKIPHFGSLPSGGPKFPDKNWTILRIFGMYVLKILVA